MTQSLEQLLQTQVARWSERVARLGGVRRCQGRGLPARPAPVRRSLLHPGPHELRGPRPPGPARRASPEHTL